MTLVGESSLCLCFVFQSVLRGSWLGIKTRVYVLYFREFLDDCCGGLELVIMFCVSESFQEDHGGGHLPQQFLPSIQLQTAPSPSSSKQRFRNTPPFSKMLTIWTSSSEHIFKSFTLSSFPLVTKM